MDGIHHIALRVTDCLASAFFYQRAFELREIRRIDDGGQVLAVWLQAGATVIMLERSLRGAGGPIGSGHVLVFSSDDLAVSEKRLLLFGIRITDRTPSTVYVEDPDGHRAGLSDYRFRETGP